MIPQKQENSQIRQFQNMRKKPFAQELFLEKEKTKLQQFLQHLKQYPRITALMIQHQERSIKTLPKRILDRFSQLNQRVGKSIFCCRKNAQFLQQVRIVLQNTLKLKQTPKIQNLFQSSPPLSCGGQQHSHSHDHASFPLSKILNIFNHLCRQYSQQDIHKQERYFVDFIKQAVRQYFNDSKVQSVKALVLGCGMGRVLLQLNNCLNQKQIPLASCLIQGHQQDPQHYLLSQYMLNHHQPSKLSIQIYPYIHNFSNNLYASTPYTPVPIALPCSPSSPFPLTFGPFFNLYKSHSQQWNVLISSFFNYEIKDVLLHIQLIYKLLKRGGIWIDVSTASFQKHLIPLFSYQQYQNILEKSQFKLINKFNKDQFWYNQPNKIMNQWRKVYYRVMKKE